MPFVSRITCLYWLDVVGADLIVSGEILYPQWGDLNGSIPSASATIESRRPARRMPDSRPITRPEGLRLPRRGAGAERGIIAALRRRKASGEWALNTQTDEHLASLIA